MGGRPALPAMAVLPPLPGEPVTRNGLLRGLAALPFIGPLAASSAKVGATIYSAEGAILERYGLLLERRWRAAFRAVGKVAVRAHRDLRSVLAADATDWADVHAARADRRHSAMTQADPEHLSLIARPFDPREMAEFVHHLTPDVEFVALGDGAAEGDYADYGSITRPQMMEVLKFVPMDACAICGLNHGKSL